MFFNKITDKFTEIVSFEIVTLHTSGMRYVCEYEIVMKDSKAEVSQYGIRFAQNEKKRILEKRAVCDENKVLKLLNDCRLLSWDGFYGSHPKGILDGTMFSLKATVNGDRKISASGSENFPKHYDELYDGIYDILNGKTNSTDLG